MYGFANQRSNLNFRLFQFKSGILCQLQQSAEAAQRNCLLSISNYGDRNLKSRSGFQTGDRTEGEVSGEGGGKGSTEQINQGEIENASR